MSKTTKQAGTIAAIRALFETAIAPITSKHVPLIAEKYGWNETTVRLQLYRWRAKSTSAAAKMAREGGTRSK